MSKSYGDIQKNIQNLIIDELEEEVVGDWEDFAEKVINEVDSKLTETVSIDDLKTQSKIFLQRIKEINLLTKDIIKNKSFSKSGLTKSINENTKLQTIQIRLWYAAAFSYSRYIHKILGLPLAKAIVVFDIEGTEQENGGASDVFAKEIFLSDLIKSAGSSGKFYIEALNNLAYREGQEGDKKVLKAFETLEEKLKEEYEKRGEQDQIDEHINRVKTAYNYIVKNTKKTKRSKHFYVRLPNQRGWGTYTFLNYGDLKEAYAAALIANHIGKNTPIDYSVDKNEVDPLCQAEKVESTLAATFFNKYVTQVNNKGALLGEDIVAYHRDLQYAVKATNAHLPSLNQYIDFAKDVCSNKIASKEMITEMANSWEKISSKTGRKKGQRNRELTKQQAKKVAYLFRKKVKKS